MTDQNKTNPQPPEEKAVKETPAAEPAKAGESKKSSKTLSANLEKIIEEIEKLSVLELANLVKALEEKFGVAAQPVVAPTPASGPQTAPGEEKPDEGQTVFNVVLTSAGANKIAVIKAVRELVPTLGLKEAKDLVEGAPKEVITQVNKAAAEEAKKKLKAAGAQVELK